MSSIYKQRPLNRVRFSIGAKLIVIISLFVIGSLGYIIANIKGDKNV